MEKIKILIVADSDEKRYEIKNILTSDELAIVAISKSGTAVLDKVASLLPEVVVMFGDENSSEYIQIAERIYVSVPSCLVVLLLENPTIKAIDDAMQAGIRKVITWPSNSKTIVENRLKGHLTWDNWDKGATMTMWIPGMTRGGEA